MKRAVLLALLCALSAEAQEEPTPFWIAPPETAAPAKKKKKKPAEVERHKKAPPPKKREKPPARVEHRAPPAQPTERAAEPQPTWIEPDQEARLPEKVRKPIEPDQEARLPEKVRKPIPVEPAEPAPRPASPSMLEPREPARTETREDPASTRAPVAPAPPPLSAAPRRVVERPRVEPRRGPGPKWTAGVVFGAWSKALSDGTGRAFDLAYGLRASRAFFDETIEADLQAVRAGGSSGSPFVSASATHNLISLRAAYVYGPQRWALLGGLGLGAAITQTHYSLQDVGGKLTGLDANSAKPTLGAFAGARVRIFGGLEARVEVDGLLRDGRTEWMPLLSAGAAF